MAAIIELKYFNAFWLKKIKAITNVVPGEIPIVSSYNSSDRKVTITQPLDITEMNVGQSTTITYTVGFDIIVWQSSIESVDPFGNWFIVTLGPPVPYVPNNEEVTLGKIIDFSNIPQSYIGGANSEVDWLLEESRIRGGYNNTTVDFGVKAYLVEEDPKQRRRFSSLIHSGIFNSRTGVNQTNQFSVAEDITRTIDPSNGSIQKLYAEDTNLIIFQESKVSKSLIDKDAIYSAEGNASVTSRNLVIGQNVAFAGEYGISTDPESFAVNGYRKYFTDRAQNVVCRLSMDGITVISSYGMTDFFRDKFSTASDNIIGGWDAHNKQYVLTIPGPRVNVGPIAEVSYETIAFDETSKGWVSRFSYSPNQIVSLNNNYFTAYKGSLYEHYTLDTDTVARGIFYGNQSSSRVTFVFNGGPSMIKNFQTINYEGDSGWAMSSFKTNTDEAFSVTPASFATSLAQMQNNLLVNNFKLKEDKYYADLVNNTSAQNGEIVFGRSSSGVKGFFGEVTMSVDNSPGKRELFAVSTGFTKSS
tara:strand:- start:1189 stop:2775 length:1587 start_codon:yes stop_codon:yes gene_type:complete